MALYFCQRRISRQSGQRAVALLAACALAFGLGAVRPATAHADEVTASQDDLRTGWDPNEAGLSPAAVSSSSFGRMFSTAVNGEVYAQPLSVGGTLIVATENNYVYGLNKVTGNIEWQDSLGAAWPASTISCGDLTPNIGSTSTPVYDPATNAVYLTTKVNDGPDAAHPHWYMQALNPSTGAELPGWPVTIQGSPTNDPTSPFNPEIELQRPGLLLLDGVVYAGFGSDCDKGSYRGYVVGVSTTTDAVSTMWTDEATTSDFGGGIWQAGGGLVSDGDGRIFVATGNGISAPVGPGDAPPPSLSESVVRLQVQNDGSLVAEDFFSPSNAPTLDANDTDLASGGPVALPDSFGTPAAPHLMVIEGKDGRVFLLNRDALGGRSQGPGGTDAVVGVTGPIEGEWGHPAVWGGDGGYVYIVGNNGPLRALQRGVTSAGLPALTIAGASTDNFGYTSGSPVVTSDGTNSGSALVWVVWSKDANGDDAQLRAYNAVPDSSGILDLAYSVPIGTATKFSVPATDGNRVYVGTRDGQVLSYGSPADTAVTMSPINFGTVQVGGSSSTSATLTANQNVTITGITTSAPFGVGGISLPRTVAAGTSIQVPVTYSPTAVGSSIGVLSIATSAGTVGVGLDGSGSQPGLSAEPASLTFTDQPTGSSITQNIEVRNTSTVDETISAATGPDGAGSPFSVTGLPAQGTTVAQGNSFVFPVTYAPTVSSAHDTAQVTITSTSGTLTIPLTGSAVTGAGDLVLNPATTAFHNVPIGSSSTLTFTLTNEGNLPVTISKAKAPDSEFATSTPMSEGLVVGPGEAITQSVTFTPTVTGAATDQYEITGDDGQGELFEQFTGAGTEPGQVIRLAGNVAIQTATAISQHDFADNATATVGGHDSQGRIQAQAVVLSRSDQFYDALAGSALAAGKKAPLLITPPAALDGAVLTEIQRILPTGGTVYLLGGLQALSQNVQNQLTAAHFKVQRFAGSNLYGTATLVDQAISAHPSKVIVATGLQFYDALSAGAAAGATPGTVVVLTSGTTIPAASLQYLNTLGSGLTDAYGAGGPGNTALDNAVHGGQITWPKTVTLHSIVGSTAPNTSLLLAAAFFAHPATLALATSAGWYDGLTGSAAAGLNGGPLLLTAPNTLFAADADYIKAQASTGDLGTVLLLGGTSALPQTIENQVNSALMGN